MLKDQLLASQEYFARSTRALEESDSEFRSHPDMMTAAQQVAHTAQTLNWFVGGASSPEGFDLNFEVQIAETMKVTSLGVARQRLEAAFAEAIRFAESASPEDLAKPLPPGPVMGGQPMSDIFWGMIEHTAHHRGALSVYTRLLGKVPPMPYADQGPLLAE